MLQRVNKASFHRWIFVAFAIILLLLAFSEQSGADYVVTAPKPGAPLPPPIAPGECPLVFLQADIQYAKQTACSSGENHMTQSPSAIVSKCITSLDFNMR